MLELMTVLSIGICLSVGVLLVAIWQVKISYKKCTIFVKKYQNGVLTKIVFHGKTQIQMEFFTYVLLAKYLICRMLLTYKCG